MADASSVDGYLPPLFFLDGYCHRFPFAHTWQAARHSGHVAFSTNRTSKQGIMPLSLRPFWRYRSMRRTAQPTVGQMMV